VADRADLWGMSAAAAAPAKRVTIDTTVGKVEILYEERTGIVSVYRFDPAGRPVAAALENWEFRDLSQVLRQDAGVPAAEAQEIAEALAEHWSVNTSAPAIAEALAAGEPRTASIFAFVLMGTATVALLVIIWTTVQTFL
jgi:hypothetical protein